MDIKEKISSLLDKQKNTLKPFHNAGENIGNDDFIGRLGVSVHRHERPLVDVQTLTPEAEEAVIDSLDTCYYESNKDVSEHELKKFPDIADIHVINGVRSRLRKQQAVISKRVSNLILQKQVNCTQEMDKIAEMQTEICKSITLCTASRFSLKQGSDQFTAATLGVLSNYNKRKKLSAVIHSLQTIQTLQMTDAQLQCLLKAEDYPGAIQLLLECLKAAETFKYFMCISDLSKKLQETLETTEEQLDLALSKVALNFSPLIYGKLFVAYGLLGKVQTMMDQLHMHLTSHIHNCAFNIVFGYVELYNAPISKEEGIQSSSFSKMQYSEICKIINHECFLSCFLDLSYGMWNILRSYQNIKGWHSSDEIFNEFKGDKKYIEETKKYITQKFDHGLLRIWQDVQAKVKTFILANDISGFKFDDFLKVLDVMNKLIDIGDAFCGSTSETLHDSIKKQSLNFFQKHHFSRMEELHMFLENEGWEVCPVKSGFLATHLVEYRFLRCAENRLLSPNSSPKKIDKNLFFSEESFNPFEHSTDESIEEDIMANNVTDPTLCEDDSDEDLPDELKKDYVEEHLDPSSHSPPEKKVELSNVPMVTNTTLTILRLFGKYIQMMRLLQPIAFDVLLCFSQMYDFYFYAIVSIFVEGGVRNGSISPRLKNTLKRIEDNFPFKSDCVDDRASDFHNRFSFHQILNDSPDTLYNLPVRVCAVESLAFLGAQLQLLKKHIEFLTPASKRGFLHQFYTSTVDLVGEVRSLVYSYIAFRIIDYEGLLGLMNSVKWDINELMSQHSSYVDILLRQLQILKMRQDELKCNHPIPPEAQDGMWQCLISLINRSLLEGFSNARKCTNEGRSLMQLDYQQFVMKLESLTAVRPFPDRSLVETYIKAFYLPEAALEEWVIANQSKYSSSQLISLITCMTHVSKRTRQKLINILEEDR